MKQSLTLLFFCFLTLPGRGAEKPLQAVPKVDLKRYAGDWYEFARTPNRFEKSCAGDVTAHYRLQADGKIGVRNECRKVDGKLEVAKGKAHVVDPVSDAKLRVSFFWPFSFAYWIIGLDEQYRWAVVGEPGRKNLWILSRSANLESAQ